MTLLLDSTIKVTLILGVALALMPLLQRQSAALRHWVLAIAVASAALAPFAQYALPSWRVPAVSPIVVPTDFTSRSIEPMNPVRAPLPAAAVATPRSAPVSPLAYVVPVWAAGAMASVLLLVAGTLRLARFALRAERVTRGKWWELSETLRRDAGLTRPVVLLLTTHPSLLVTWGYRRPRLIIPAGARGWSEDRIRLVLEHELAHIRRGDWLVQCLAELLRAIYWFNPLIWIVCRRLRQESECAADDAVLARGVEGPDYATALVDIARDLRQRRVWVPAPAIAHTSGFERRIKAMLDTRLNRRPLTRRNAALTIVSCLAIAIPIAAAQAALSSISGVIVDPTNAVLPGVQLTLTNTQTGAKIEVQSSREGRYEFAGLPAGEYLFESKLPGFAAVTGKIVVTGQDVQRDLKLDVGSLQETITVGAGAGWPPPPPVDPVEAEARKAKFEEMRARLAKSVCGGGGTPTNTPRIGGNIRVPMKLRDMRPVYPASLAATGTSGTVLLRAVIDPEGNVNEVVVQSATNPEFATSAINAVRQWQFSQTLLNCQTIEVTMNVAVNFDYRP
jgi:TonB family protein